MKSSKGLKILFLAVAVLFLVLGFVFSIKQKGVQNKSPGVDNGDGSGTQVSESKPVKEPLYRCPMHPHITSNKPGKCPICHMDLQLVEEDVPQTQSDTSGAAAAPVADVVVGRTGFYLSPQKQQMIGVTTTLVKRAHLQKVVRASGKVAFDPELFTAIEEYKQAVRSLSQMKSGGSFPGLREQTAALVRSAQTKLRLMGLTDGQIKALNREKSDAMNLLLPQGKAWIYAEVFEYEMTGIKPGQEVEVEAPALGNTTFVGKVAAVSPVLNAPSRTFKVRAEVPDPNGELRPDTFVNVKIKLDLGEKISIPVDSVLHSGNENFVFVVKEEGTFEPRSVHLGQTAGESYEVLHGLKEGEKIVTAANFLIDSESKLRAVLKQMSSSGTPPPASAPGPHSGHGAGQ